MSLSVFDVFKIGIGPSSSHTMGPMNAARCFVELLAVRGLLERTAEISAQLYGSLALTGRGHCTDRAILLGLEGASPDTIDPALIEPALQRIRASGRIRGACARPGTSAFRFARCWIFLPPWRAGCWPRSPASTG